MRLVDHFLKQCRSTPDGIALHQLSAGYQTTTWSWYELEQLVYTTAQWLLAECDLPQTGSVHLATWLPNCVDWIAIDLATQLLGWVHVALDKRLPWTTAVGLAGHSCANALIVPADYRSTDKVSFQVRPVPTQLATNRARGDREYSSRLETRPHDGSLQADRPAQILYTSGTISDPKGVVLTHGNLLSNAQAKLTAAPQLASDVRLNILPFAHAYARTCELSTWILSGSQLCIVPDWPQFLQWAPRIEPSLVNLVPHLAQKLADQFRERVRRGRSDQSSQSSDSTTDDAIACGAELLGSRMRLLQVGGAALPRDVWDCLARAGWPPLQGYGLTETSPVICSNIAGQQQPDSVGPPVCNVDLRIDDMGVLWTRGPHVMQCYWNDPVATQTKIVDGWLSTGDLAQWQDDGALRILGRTDDQIALSTGYKVQPLELNRRLANDPWLESLVIVGQNRPYITALVWPSAAQLPAELFTMDTSMQCRAIDVVRLTNALIARWQSLLSDLPRAMQIERILIMPEPLTIENGGLNFKGAVRRRFVEEVLFASEITRAYGT